MLTIRPLGPYDEAEALLAQAELADGDFPFLLDDTPGQSWERYVERLEEVRQGIDLAPDRVAATFLVGEVDGHLIGRVSIRHELNDFLAAYGGHIGYAVRPAYRRRGYATELLRHGLAVAKGVGITRALLTCDVGNEGSERTITACGGVLENIVEMPDGGGARARYWIG
ncbi:GNAT family N-acetyltransferase [Acidothermaceae bacterium B102]|nr:GNAT family N-acetyltransferase [Acidothermaceae bacterium B102]